MTEPNKSKNPTSCPKYEVGRRVYINFNNVIYACYIDAYLGRNTWRLSAGVIFGKRVNVNPIYRNAKFIYPTKQEAEKGL